MTTEHPAVPLTPIRPAVDIAQILDSIREAFKRFAAWVSERIARWFPALDYVRPHWRVTDPRLRSQLLRMDRRAARRARRRR